MKRNLALAAIALAFAGLTVGCSSTQTHEAANDKTAMNNDGRTPASGTDQAAPPNITRADAIAQLKKIESTSKICFDKNLDQMGMDSCAGDQIDAADALLNKVYQEKMKSLSPEGQRSLRVQERQFVKAKVKAENEIEGDGGSIAPMEASLKDYELTKKQILKLLK